jgi:hypothetical protein
VTARLLPCPFCGGDAKELRKSGSGGAGSSGMEPDLRAIGCDAYACDVRPTTSWVPEEEYDWAERRYLATSWRLRAEAVWNKRPAP